MAALKRIGLALLVVLLTVLPIQSAALAQIELPPSKPTDLKDPSPYTNSFWEKLARLSEDRQLQDLVEKEVDRSFVIRGQIQEEVDRAFSHTTGLLNVLLGVLTFLPVLAGVGVWFIRRSVITQILGDTQQQLREEVAKQFEQEIAAELKEQAEAFKQEIESLRSDFNDQLAQLKNLFLDAQNAKDRIIQELSQITPPPIPDAASPEVQQKIHVLTQQLEQLTSSNTSLLFSVNDYVEQGKALYFEGRFEAAIAAYDKAIAMDKTNYRAWFGRGATFGKLQKLEEAIAAHETATQLKPDFAEAWFGQGSGLAKLQKFDAAIAAYDKATQLKPDFLPAWFGKARCYAMQANLAMALESLKRAIELNPEKCKEVLKTDTAFEVLRTTEEFQALLNSNYEQR